MAGDYLYIDYIFVHIGWNFIHVVPVKPYVYTHQSVQPRNGSENGEILGRS